MGMPSSPDTSQTASPDASPPNTTSTAATVTSVRKPEPAIIHQGGESSSPTSTSPTTAPTFASKGSIFPIPGFRRASLVDNAGPNRRSSLGNTLNVKGGDPQQQQDGKISPPVANRRGSATTSSPPAANRLSQSWLADVSEDGAAGRGEGDGLEWDLEKGVKLDDLKASRIKGSAAAGSRRRSDGNTPTNHSAATAANVNPEQAQQQNAQAAERTSIASRPSSTLNELDEDDGEQDWSHYHPCYPHPNPHVPLHSEEFQTTRVIRIPRDYEINGDNTPAYSIVYPVILDPYVTEEQFRALVDTLNEGLRTAFDPWNKWNWLDAVLGLVTLWIWEEIWPSYVKRRLKEVDVVVEEWNERLRGQGARVIELRRTGYINLDIQIPDPLAEDSEDGASTVEDVRNNANETTSAANDNGAQKSPQNGVAEHHTRQMTLSDAETSIPAVTVNGDYVYR